MESNNLMSSARHLGAWLDCTLSVNIDRLVYADISMQTQNTCRCPPSLAADDVSQDKDWKRTNFILIKDDRNDKVTPPARSVAVLLIN